jgi:hypothetical protein
MSLPADTIRRMRLLAALALLIHMCWPFAGSLLGQPRIGAPERVQVVCAVHGTMLVPAEVPPASQVAKPQACALCGAVGVLLAASDSPPLIADPAGSTVESLVVASPARATTYSPARPRGPPPAFS